MLTILSSTVSLFTPLLLGKAINTFNIKTNLVDTSLLRVILIALVSCYLASWIIDTLNGVLMTKVTQKLVKHIRSEFFAKLQRIPLNFYDTRAHGDTMSRITNDVDNISSTISQTTTQLIASIFSITGAFVMMLILSPILTLVAMVSIPLFLIIDKNHCQPQSKVFFRPAAKAGCFKRSD